MNFWLSSFVNRWHTHPHLAVTRDTISGHQQRVTMILLALEPDISRVAIIRGITHDQGEAWTGDWSYTFKKANPEIRVVGKESEEADVLRQGVDPSTLTGLTEREEELVTLSDWTDSFLWARHHHKNIVTQEAWVHQLSSMLEMAERLGVLDNLIKILEESNCE